MIRLSNSTTDLLRVTPTSTNAVKAVVHYSDKNVSGYTGANQATSIAAASITTICGTPAASTIRDIDHVTLYCALANTLTVGHTVSGTEYILIVTTLAAGDTLEYTHASGWRVLDSSGQTKFVMPGYLPLTGGTVSGATTFSTTLTTAAITASGLITANAGISVAASQAITGNVANSTISGFLSVAATTGTFTNVGGTLSTAAQPNVTSLGTLTNGLVVSGTSSSVVATTAFFDIQGGDARIKTFGANASTLGTFKLTQAHSDNTGVVNTIIVDASGNTTLAGSLSTGSNSISGGVISGTSTFNITGTGPHAIGGATNSANQFRLTGNWTTGATLAYGLVIDNTVTNVSTGELATAYIGGTLNGVGTASTHGVGLLLVPPVITGTNSTNTTTLRITGAPSGSGTNRALWVAAGLSQFDGEVRLGNTVNSVSPTSPNRTVTMVIGGTTYYLAAKTTND